MDREAGPQVATQDCFDYASHPLYHHQLIAENGYGSIYGSKQVALSASFNPTAAESATDDHSGNAQWKGFTSFRLQRGPQVRKSVNLSDAERQNLTGASDLKLDVAESNIVIDSCNSEQKRKRSLVNSSNSLQIVESISEEDPGGLSLKLSFTAGADDASNGIRNSKRFRSSSPGNQAPVCQVDDCHVDLKHAKDYHRRHKVCESHSKAPECLVQKALQRFCQQCSRFHPLPEFDEGKRSCRRRLDGHNKRRRKTDVATNLAPLSEVVKGTNQLIGIVALLSQLQAAKANGNPEEYESSLQFHRKPLPSTCLPSVSSTVAPQSHQSYGEPQRSNQGPQKANTVSLEGHQKDALVLLLQNVLQNQAMTVQRKTQSQQMPSGYTANEQNVRAVHLNTGNSSEDHSRNVLGDTLPLDMVGNFKSSSESDPGELWSRPGIFKQPLGHSDSSSFEEENADSPPNSMATRPLEEQNFFPIESGGGFGSAEGDRGSRGFWKSGLEFQEEELNLSPCYPPSQFEAGVEKSNLPPCDSSEYASNNSPSSSSSNEQGMRKNGRMIFKLCDPQHVETMTQTHESEIQQWLSLKPCCLEGYLRPGCVLFTVFLSMPLETWEQLVTNLPGSLEKLVRFAQSDLWKKGRILVQVGHSRALIVNGRVKKSRFLRASKTPQLRSVRPLAIVAGQETTLSVYVDNLVPETRIVCVYRGRYILHEVPWSGSKSMGCNPFSIGSKSSMDVQEFHFPGGPANVLGRCFIEVEHGFMGNALPVIVANKEICTELQSLELDLDSDLAEDAERSRDSAEAMNFLHELGWIFQSTSGQANEYFSSEGGAAPQIGLSCFKGVLKYAIWRDWCAVVKQLLDLLFLFGAEDDLEILRVLLEVNLLHHAVERKCKSMVDLLLHYKPAEHRLRKQNVFTPVAEGPGGFTPLHVAARMSDAVEIVDILTEDPSQAGLHGWKTACDRSGRTPEWHARHRGHFSYIELVQKKLLKKLSPSVRITILDETESCPEINIDSGNACPTRTEFLGTTTFEISGLPQRAAASCGPVCRGCGLSARRGRCRLARTHSKLYKPLMMMMVAVAAICATVALLYKSGPRLDSVMYSLKWEGIMYGPL